MKIKAIEVLDTHGTDMWFWVGKMDEEDKELMERTGWGKDTTVIIKPLAHGPSEVVVSNLCNPEIDLIERGNLELNRTTYLLAKAVARIPFECLPSQYDFRSYPQVRL